MKELLISYKVSLFTILICIWVNLKLISMNLLRPYVEEEVCSWTQVWCKESEDLKVSHSKMLSVPSDKEELEDPEYQEHSEVKFQDQQDSFQVKSHYLIEMSYVRDMKEWMLYNYKIKTNKANLNHPQSLLNLNNNKINKFISLNLMYKILMEGWSI